MKISKTKFPKLTDFQKRVFSLLPKKGKVTTYKNIAQKLKTSPRAVGNALKNNPYPIKIPCHRVIRSNGKIGGFKLGVKKKQWLLRKEGILLLHINLFLYRLSKS